MILRIITLKPCNMRTETSEEKNSDQFHFFPIGIPGTQVDLVNELLVPSSLAPGIWDYA